MRPVVLLCSVLLAVPVVCRAYHDSDSDEECDCEKRFGGFQGDILRNRADNNDVEINRLFNAAWKLEEVLDKLKSSGPKVDELKARVDALTGNDCVGHAEGRLFECDDRSACISPLHTCDGYDDCGDHSDETEVTCTNLCPTGSSWGAAISHNECFKNAADHLRVVIAAAERSEIFPASVHLDVTTFLHKKDGELSIGQAEGFYYFGTRSAKITATDGDILELEIRFNRAQTDIAHGILHRGFSQEACGEIILVRE